MSLVAEQDIFLSDVARLISKAHDLGFQISAGEMWRTPEQQKIYFDSGRSKTMDSNHIKRLAVDLNFFKDGKLIGDKGTLQPIGEWWESLNPQNRWGGSWRGLVENGKSNFVDLPHFERNIT